MDAHSLVRETIYRSTILLDSTELEWGGWSIAIRQFQYAIRSCSPEINKDMTYLELDRKGLESMVKLLPKHNTDHSPLTRHTSVYTVDVNGGADGKSGELGHRLSEYARRH